MKQTFNIRKLFRGDTTSFKRVNDSNGNQQSIKFSWGKNLLPFLSVLVKSRPSFGGFADVPKDFSARFWFIDCIKTQLSSVI